MDYKEMKAVLVSFDDPVEKLEIVMDFGKKLLDIPTGLPCTEILGCASFVKICRSLDNKFYGTADSALVSGILSIILAMVDNKTPEQIKKMDLNKEFSSLDLNLGMGRLNGINSMISFLENL